MNTPRPYKLLILGYDPETIQQSTCSFQFNTLMLKKNFERMGHVKTKSLSILKWTGQFPLFPAITPTTDLPEVDFVLIISFPVKINAEQIEIIRNKTKAIKVVGLCENSFSEAKIDHSFVFNSYFLKDNNTQFISLPCSKELLKPTKKTPNTILIDHHWKPYLNTKDDWTSKIEDWLYDVRLNYKIYRLLKFVGEEAYVKSFELPLSNLDYLSYLDATKHISNFIVTHRETYAYSVIDMAARGTRVLAPPNFLCPCMIEALGIQIFNTKQELINIIQKPVGIEWESKVNNCTDYYDVARIIDRKFQEWMKPIKIL